MAIGARNHLSSVSDFNSANHARAVDKGRDETEDNSAVGRLPFQVTTTAANRQSRRQWSNYSIKYRKKIMATRKLGQNRGYTNLNCITD